MPGSSVARNESRCAKSAFKIKFSNQKVKVRACRKQVYLGIQCLKNAKLNTEILKVLFNPGYNTTDFLVDFLRYYNCRPPYARNCIYEEKVWY